MADMFIKEFPIRIYEAGRDGTLSFPGVMNLFQDTATDHAAILGVGLPQMLPKGMSWFITRCHLKIYKYPQYGDTLRIRTWPKGRKKVFAYRDFELSLGNEVTGVGSSVWCLIDLKTKRALPPSRVLPPFAERDEDALVTNFPSIPSVESFENELRFYPRKSEIDLNQHVNNVAYMNWALETIPEGVTDGLNPSEIQIFFKKEAQRGDRILSKVNVTEGKNGIETIHLLLNETKDTEVFKQRIMWTSGNLKDESYNELTCLQPCIS